MILRNIAAGTGLLLAVLILHSCTTTVSHQVIQVCRLYCDSRGGLHQIVVDRFKGNGCHCRSSRIVWLNMSDDGVFEDIKNLGEEFEEFRDLGSLPDPKDNWR